MPDDGLLLDTDIVSLFGRLKSPPGLRPWLARVGIFRLAISYPTITELMRGAHLRRKDDPEKAREIMAWVRRILASNFPIPEMTAEVAEVYAHMTAVPSLRDMWTVQRQQKSNRLGHDLMIAAVSITHQLPIVTANVSDYLKIHDRFPLPGLYHPMQARWHLLPVRTTSMPIFTRHARDRSCGLLPRIGDEPEGTRYPRPSGSKNNERPNTRATVSLVGVRNRSVGRGALVYVSRSKTIAGPSLDTEYAVAGIC